MAIKKPLYLTKNDFLNYFDRPSQLWFFSTNEIVGTIEQILGSSGEDEYDESNLEESESEIETVEFDVLELIKEEKLTPNIYDENDPRIIEGKIIAEQAQNYLVRVAKQTLKINNIINFDQLYQDNLADIQKRAEFTKQVIFDTKQPTLFLHPVFTHNHFVSIPDAIVFIHDHYELYETKGVTNSKRIYALEFLYHTRIIKPTLQKLDEASLFLIEYEQKNKGQISFTRINVTKSSKAGNSSLPKEFKDWSFYNIELIKAKQIAKKTSSSLINLADIINLDFNNIRNHKNSIVPNKKPLLDEDEQEHKKAKKRKPTINQKALTIVANLLEKVNEQFDAILTTIYQTQNLTTVEINLSNAYKTDWRDFRFRPQIQKIYAKKGFSIFNYSGKLIEWDQMFLFINDCGPIEYDQPSKYTIEKFKIWWEQVFGKNHERNKKVKNLTKAFETYLNVLQPSNSKVAGIYCYEAAYDFFKKLKAKKVYFDFETISLAIRVIDHSLPFMQIVTQCSIIKDHGNGFEKEENLIVDPINIKTTFFKKIVDHLYETNADEYSYVVYNASFEKGRLLEMKAIINDDEYNHKIDKIVRNLYDLADFFNLSKQNIVLKDLKGYYSIKAVLPLVPQKFLDVTKTKSYRTLNIRKGDQAQAHTSLRFFSKYDDLTWQIKVQELKDYCENDVRAMIAVEYYVADILERFKPFIKRQPHEPKNHQN